jgi:signal transduction histidine kinase
VSRDPADDRPDFARAGDSELVALSVRAEELRHRAANGQGTPEELLAELEQAIVELRIVHEDFVLRAQDHEQRAQAERQRYVDLLAFAPVGYLVTDQHGKIREANRAFSELVERVDLSARPLPLLVGSAERRSFRQLLIRIGRDAAMEDWEGTLLSGRGRPVAVAMRALPEPSERGLGVIRWLVRDMTAQRRGEEQIRNLQADLELSADARDHDAEQLTARLAAVLRQLPEGIVIVGPDGEVQLANQRAEELLARAEAFATDAVDRALQGEKTSGRADVERGREKLVVEYAATPVRDASGEVVAGVLTFRDVTERELRERAQRDFVTNAAHELQTPLAAIASAVQVLKAGAKNDVMSRDRFLDHIDTAVNRLDRLTRALLILARAQSRQEPPREEVIAVRPLLEGVASALRPTIVPIMVTCAKETAVIANRPLLEQALVNLAGNALKYSRSRVVLGARPVDGRVLIEVTDSGPGIPHSEQQHIFNRFYRLGSREGDGFGLGLAIVRDAVEALNGELELDSSSKGTRISILLAGARVRGT